MLKILQTTPIARRLGLLLLATAIVLPCRAGTAALSTLYNFTDLSDGGLPEAGLVLASSGALFGTTSSGGLGWGSVFELIPSNGGSTWTEKTIYDFTGGADGANPVANLLIGKNNILYGTTYSGGAHDYGTVFELLPAAGGAWTQKVLYSFAGGSDGANPAAGLTLLSKNGVLYGTTYGGGSLGVGTVFEMIPAVGGWTEQVLYTFQGGADGAKPLSDLALSSSGSLFGTTSQGGIGPPITNQPPTCTPSSPCYDENWGTVFELTPTGGGVWTESVLYTFTGQTDGGSPESAVIIGTNGVLYGSTFWGGIDTVCPLGDYPQGCGTVFQLAPPTGSGTAWTESVLYSFTGHSPDGSHPYGNLGLNTAGELFGTTFSGGANVDVCFPESYTGCGSIFSVKPPKKGSTWIKSNITVFPGPPGGGSPNGLILSKGGDMYGTTIVGGAAGGYGTVFMMTP
jgi:uncharacterized repeat protein (TIGR03803 family)